METTKEKLILVIEDDADIRELFKSALLLEGYRVETLSNGKDAWHLLNTMEQPPSALVLDLMMPVMNGWQFLELKFQSEKLKSIPTLILSATSEKNFPPAQPNHLTMKKPFDLNHFLDTVKRLTS